MAADQLRRQRAQALERGTDIERAYVAALAQLRAGDMAARAQTLGQRVTRGAQRLARRLDRYHAA